MASDSSKRNVAIRGSEKRAVADFDGLSKLPADESFEITVRLRRKNHLPPVERLASQHARHGVRLLHDELLSRHGASPQDMQAILDFAKTSGLQVIEGKPEMRRVILRGTAAAYEQAFGTDLRTATRRGRLCRVRQGGIHVPEELAGLITSVTGLDNRPFAKPHVRLGRQAAHAAGAAGTAMQTVLQSTAFTPIEIASLYNFPPGLTGAGQTIAILELGGGFRSDELTTYFGSLGIRQPHVSAASTVLGGANNPGTDALDPFCYDTEVMLDIQIAGAIAPGANVVVYFAPDDSDQSFLAAMSAIIHDTVNNPRIVSISWGASEDNATEQFRHEFDQMLQAAAHMGMTVCVATGDNGAANFATDDPRWDHKAHLDFPASSPFALACGGTRISAAGGQLVSEEVWYDGPNDGTGGGISRFFPLPDYQANAGVPRAANPDGPVMRGTPDVSGNASPLTGYRILCIGQKFPDPERGIPAIGGTSAVAPLWAALIALLNEGLGKPCGFVNPLLYEVAQESGVFRNITSGTNGAYTAGPGWDPCTGLGTPDGTKLLEALRKRLA